MKLSICTDVLGNLSYPDMLDKVKSMGINAVEMTAGGWGGCSHINTMELLKDDGKLKAFKEELTKRDMEISALNCSGNPLCPGEMGYRHDTGYAEGRICESGAARGASILRAVRYHIDCCLL